MRLAGPIYESLPIVYAAIGAFAIVVSYVDAEAARAAVTFVVGVGAEIAALTLILRRRGYREMRREYSGGDIGPPAAAPGKRDPTDARGA